MPNGFKQARWPSLTACMGFCEGRLSNVQAALFMGLLILGGLSWLTACTSAASAVATTGAATGPHPMSTPTLSPPQVRISTWTSPHGLAHEVAIWRPSLGIHADHNHHDIERVYVLPGSGCTGMAPILPSYFEGLSAREIIVLHKPHVLASDWPCPTPCHPGFVAQDELASWSRAWRHFMAQDMRERPVPPSRVLLVGISEGAELLPGLLADWPDVGLAVLLGSTGLDPWEALLLQLEREHDITFAQAIEARLIEGTADAWLHSSGSLVNAEEQRLLGGRTPKYWHSLRHWPVSGPLQESRTPTLILMGDEDAVQAPEGLLRFAKLHQRPGLCTRLVPGADHGLGVKGRQWPGMWPLVQSLIAAPTALAFTQQCVQQVE